MTDPTAETTTPQTQGSPLRTLAIFAPVVIFSALAGLFATQLLSGRSDALPSALIDQPAPEFDMPPLRDDDMGLATADLATGRVSVVNVWASWCGPCRAEHPELMALAEMDVADVHGINYRDKRDAALGFIDSLGDPFDRIGVDEKGMHALRWGVTGVPETFIVSGDGRIVYKHVGPINPTDLERIILPAIEAAGS